MAVVNRFEIANFLNLTSVSPEERSWEPGYRHVVTKEFNGRNVAVVAANGVGKTTFVRSVLAIMSRHRPFVQMLRKRAAPKRKGRYSHVRIEFIHSDRPLNDDLVYRYDDNAKVEGERYVYGVYLNYDSDMWFYAYQGTLEDCPCAVKSGDFTEIVPNDRFRETLKKQKGYVDGKAIGLHAWENETHKMIDKATLDQLVQYQKAGAGEGGKDFFSLKGVHNEKTYAAEFFYEHLAPEILVHVMGAEGDHDEVRFETTVCKASKAIFAAERKSKEASEEFERTEHTFKLFEGVIWKLDDYIEQVKNHHALSRNVSAEATLIDRIVARQPIFGMPESSSPPHSDQQFFVERLVLHKGEWLVPDWVLAEVFGTSSSRVNEIAGPSRKNISGLKIGSSQVIEKTCDLGFSRNDRVHGGGYKNTYYPLPAALNLVRESGNFAANWTKDRAQSALNLGYDWLEKNDRPNALRRKACDLTLQRQEMDTKIDELEKLLEKQKQECGDLQSQLKDADAARQAFNAMASSGCFCAEEMQNPLKTGGQARADFENAVKQRERHQQRHARLRDRHDEYLQFVTVYGQSATPEGVLRDLQDRKAVAVKVEEKARKAKNAALAALKAFRSVQKQLDAVLRRRDATQAEMDKLNTLAAKSASYVDVFGEETPMDMETRVKTEEAAAERDTSDLHKELTRLQDDVKRLEVFEEEHPKKTPQRLILDRQHQLEEIILRRQSLSEDMEDCEERLLSWESAKAAPGRVSKRTTHIVKSAGLNCSSLHEVVSKMSADDCERKTTLLTYFSAILFAPVAETKEEAVNIAHALACADHESPVFLLDEVEKFCADCLENIITDDQAGIAYNYMLGVRTRSVDCLLNPAAIEDEKTRLRNAIAAIKSDIDGLNAQLSTLLPTSEFGRYLAELEVLSQANPRDGVVRVKEALLAAEKRLKVAKERASEQHIALIRIRRRFHEAGGKKQVANLKREVETAESERLSLIREIGDQTADQLETTVAAADSDLSEKQAKLTAIRIQLNGADRLRLLETFVRDGDLEFMETAQETLVHLQRAESKKEIRLGHPQPFNFQLAQQAVELGKSTEEDLTRKISFLRSDINAGNEKLTKLRRELRTVADAVPQVEANANKLESLVASLQTSYRRMKHATREAEDALDFSNEDETGALRHIYGYLHELSENVSEGRFEEALEYVEGIVEAISDLQIDTRIKEIRESSWKKDRAQRTYVKALEDAEKDKRADFNQSEKSILRNASIDSAGNGTGEIRSFYEHLEKEVTKRREMYEKTSADVANATANLDLRLHNFMSKLEENFEQMKRDLRWKISGDEIIEAGIEIEASIVDDAHREEALKKVLQFIRQQDERRAEDKATGIVSKNDDDLYNENLEARIRNLLYRHIFKSADGSEDGPKIYLRHPAFNPDKKVPFNGNFSQGQKDALTLMLLVKLADFAVNRDIHAFSAPGSRKRKKLSNQTKVIFIDGLFSNLSDGELCEKALEPLKRTRGNFQLIGFIHNKDYKNDDKLFPNLVHLVKVGGRSGKYVFVKSPTSGKELEIVSVEHEEVAAIGCHVTHAPPKKLSA